MHAEGGSQEAERLVAAAEELIARAAAFYRHWFGHPMVTEGLTDDAKGVIRRATEVAQRLMHNYIGTEHVLVGLVGDEASLPAAVLAERGVTLVNVQRLMEHRLGRGATPVGASMSLVPRVKTVIEMAFAEARRMDAPAVGAEHLLLGVLREGCGVASLMLESLGADVYDVRERVLAALADR
jgi:ATP-dependent Clp protease ATP-binding subunit ClpC